MFMEAQGMGQSAASSSVGIFCRHSPQAVLSVRLCVARGELAEGVRDALAQLRRRTPRSRAAGSGAPFIAYRRITPEMVEIEVGLPVDSALDEIGSVATVPMGRFVSSSAPLSESAVADIFRRLEDWFVQHAEHASGPVYTTIIPGSEPGAVDVLVQRRICAGRESTDEACAGAALLDADASRLTQVGLRELARNQRAFDPTSPDLEQRDVTRDAYVADVMIRSVISCQRGESLLSAAQRMWDHDIGALPVVDAARQPIAMITDRDICMAAYTQGRRLAEIPVGSAMSRTVHVCHADDALRSAEQRMAAHQVQRLPVVDQRGALIGIISLSDLLQRRAPAPLRMRPRQNNDQGMGQSIDRTESSHA